MVGDDLADLSEEEVGGARKWEEPLQRMHVFNSVGSALTSSKTKSLNRVCFSDISRINVRKRKNKDSSGREQ